MQRLAAFAIALAVAGCAGATAGPVKTSKKEARALRWIDRHVPEQVAFIEKTVNINSGTMNLEGVREVGAVYDQAFRDLGFQTEWVELPPEMHRAGHFIARKPGRGNGKRILLIGHLDTVFEKDSPFQKFERLGEDAAAGPGTNDMKGGNAVILYALRALADAGLLADIEVTVVFTGDEEHPGAPLAITRKPLLDAVAQSDVALGFEALVADLHNATVARRGFIGWTLRVEGKSGHSSLIFKDEYGYGAIYEAARILDGFRTELAGEENLSFSPGRILGGSEITHDVEQARGTVSGKRNVIPQIVEASGDLRALTPEQVERAKAAMQTIVAANLPGTSARLEFDEGYPPMAPTEGNQQLLGVLDRINRDLGHGPMKPVPPADRGAADISFAAPHLPSLDGLGLLGKGDHSIEERVDLRSVPLATKRAALLIHRLSRHPR
jgi:glutamate carboxypeptidase